MDTIVDRMRSACTRCAAFAGKWLLTIFVGVAAFALAAQALALVLAALALLLLALCLASLCMPEESRAVWAWMRETLGRWSAVAGTDNADAEQAAAQQAGQFAAEPAQKSESTSLTPQACGQGQDTAVK